MEYTMEIKKIFSNIFGTISYEKISNIYYKTFPKEFFKLDNKKVRISYINEEFQKILDEVGEETITHGALAKGVLKEKTCPKDILINNEAKSVFLSEIYFKLERQGNGGKGDLVIKRFSSRTNLFFFKDKKGFKFLIYVVWDRRRNGWSIIANRIKNNDDKKLLPKRSNVFYRQ